MTLDSLVADANELNREYESKLGEENPSSSLWGYVNERKESGELRSLSAELGEAIGGVLAAPNEKLGEGKGPGIGGATTRDVTA